MTRARVVHVCGAEPVRVTNRTTYANFRAAILQAGRFSVFDATETMRAARLYDRLCRDPRLKITILAFPWTGVERKRKRAGRGGGR